ncbi:hypothetical protein KXV22_003441 [Aspergillus fumigatus]|uniref:Cytochrome P450 n=1 Tax=Aspergillus fumigatus TaxID=746128 RepID=A0A9P8NN16_ASPFM|nr:hypothetical protein KXX47_004120 [Aspergillus fumigatus]KAH1416273.1 hypothetical protein KXX64_004859 [Aspergillus fumigatus]KAH1661231.1 hypothetical protein KXX65_003545 [Aspergillus fumigatus]KAH1740558.1 hypothetical protein KXX09_002947 [Aspergillus fumigatus]KAH1806744.1 hypothetical protein KXX19_002244 [Aspergillus fumigatus]
MSDPNTTAVRPVPRVGFATIVLGLIVLGILRWAYACYKWNQKYKLPARVPGIPILGNSLQVPAVQQGPWAKDLAAKYGEMYVGVPFPSLPSREDVELKHKRNRFTCQFGGSTWVFLNSSRVVKDLLEKRAAIYNSRPPFPMTQDIISRGGRIVLMPYGERWRLVRRVMHQILSVTNQPMFQPFQDLESRQLFWDYLHKPDRWFAANGRYANSVIMSVVFGRRSLLDDPDVAELFETIELFLAEQQPGGESGGCVPGAGELAPVLAVVAAAGRSGFSRRPSTRGRQTGTTNPRRYEAKMLRGEFLASKEITQMDEVTKLFVFGSLMEAGSDTSRVTLGQIIAGAITYPDWVTRAREQLDRVCGAHAERLPGWDDRPRLPYITAVVKEGFRWRPNIAEIGAPTVLIKDDEYEGSRFPKGTVFTWNAWAIALSPDEYEQPERFWPDRFLNEDLENALKGHGAFGPGRRVCAGWKVGETNVWIAIARLLYCFDFHPVPGQPIDTMRIPQLAGNAASFAARVSVRSPAHAELIRRECAEAVKTQY